MLVTCRQNILFHYYAIFPPDEEHRASTMDLHLTLFLEVFFASVQVIFFSQASLSCTLHVQYCFGQPLLLNPWGFHSIAQRVILCSGLWGICPIHFHFLLLMLSSIRLGCVLSHRSLFEMTSGQWIFRIFLKHLLINVCNFLTSSFIDRQVSEP